MFLISVSLLQDLLYITYGHVVPSAVYKPLFIYLTIYSFILKTACIYGQSMPITSVRRSWPMQILKGSLYVMKELLKMTDVS